MNRIEQLADRPEIPPAGDRVPFTHMIPLDEIISESLQVGKASKKVKVLYDILIKAFEQELKILLDLPLTEIASVDTRVAEGIGKVRKGELQISPGFDGQYGQVHIFKNVAEFPLAIQKEQRTSSESSQPGLF